MHSEENSCNLIGLKIYPPLLFLLYWKIHGTTEGWQMLFSLEANTGLYNTSEEKTRQKHMDSDPPFLSHWGKRWEGGDMHPDISNQIINHLVCSQPWTSISLSSNQAICWKFLSRTHNPMQNEDSHAPPPNYCSHLGSLPVPTTHLLLKSSSINVTSTRSLISYFFSISIITALIWVVLASYNNKHVSFTPSCTPLQGIKSASLSPSFVKNITPLGHQTVHSDKKLMVSMHILHSVWNYLHYKWARRC